jgi:hypothetical protein
MIQRECRDRLQVADVPKSEWPDLSDPKRLPILSLPAWRAVMQMDQNSTPLPDKLRMHLDRDENLLQIDMPSADAIPTTTAGPADDVGLLGRPVKPGGARAGAIQDLRAGSQTIRLWPLPAPSPAGAAR